MHLTSYIEYIQYLTNKSSKCDFIFETANDNAATAAKYSIGGNEEFCGLAEAIFNKNVVLAYRITTQHQNIWIEIAVSWKRLLA